MKTKNSLWLLLVAALLPGIPLNARGVGGTVIAWGNNDFGQTTLPPTLTNAVAVKAGHYHSLALRADGTVVAWGDNRYGQTNVPPGLVGVATIVAGHDHNLALRADGTAMGWGNNNFGQTNIPPGAANIVGVAAGIEFSAVLRADGSIQVWGNTGFGLATVPAAATNVVELQAGGSHLLARRADGTVVAWGRNDYGQARVPGGLTNVVAVAAGAYHSVAVLADGTVVGWGLNADGEGAPPAGGLNDAQKISAGYFHNLVVRADASLAAWGYNGAGQLGVPDAATNVVAVAAGLDHSLAIRSVAPVVTTAPASQTVVAGAAATFTVAGAGTAPLAYQWQFNGTNLPGATSATLSLANVQFAEGGPYRAIVGNLSGSVTSSVATLTVISGPVFTTQPTNATVILNATATFTAAAMGTPAPNFQWQFAGVDIPGANSATLTVANCQATNAGNYRVIVSNAAGTNTSDAAALTVLLPPQILLDPAPQTVVATSNATFLVRAGGSAPLAFQWQFENADIPDATNQIHTVTAARPIDAGNYRVRVSNAAGTNFSAAAALTVNVPPVITANPLGQSANAGTSVSFSVGVTGTPPLAYQWNFNDVTLPGKTNATLDLANVQATNAGLYSVTIGNVAGTVTSFAALLTVITPPVITGQPTSQTVPGGSLVTLFAEVSGSFPLDYQWSFNGAPLPGAVQPFLDLPEIQAPHAGRYSVTVTNAAGRATSAPAWLRVRTLGEVIAWGDDRDDQATLPPALVGARDMLHVAGGGEHSLALRGEGSVTAWGFNGYGQCNVPAGATNVSDLAGGGNHSLAARADGSVLAWGRNFEGESTVPAGLSNITAVAAGFGHSLALRADGRVFAWGYNGYNQRTVPATLTNAVAIAGGYYHSLALRADGSVAAWGDNRLNQTRVPASATNVIAIAAGDSHCLAARGDGTVVAWGLNSEGQTTVPAAATNVIAVAAGHAHSAALRADGVVIVWGRSVENQNLVPPTAGPKAALAAGANHNLALAAVGPRFTLNPLSQTFVAGSSAVFTGAADGTPLVSYQWQASGTNLPGATSATLLLNNVQPINEAGYTLIASNFVNVSTSLVAQLTVLVPPRITTQPLNGGVNAGASVTLTVAATGTAPLAYQWRGLGGPLADETNSTFTIASFAAADAGRYRVVITNAAGVVTSSIATLSLNLPPAITNQPANRTVVASSNATFSVTAGGTPPLAYQWQFNNGDLPGRTNAALTITNAQPANEGAYSVRLSNVAGVTNSAAATLTVLVPPTFTSQPASRTVVVGTDVTFTLAVSGTPAPVIQWRFKNTPIPDATNASYTVTAARTNDAGAYDAIVSNPARTNASAVATLTVLELARILSDPASQNANAGATVIFGVTAAGTPPLLYQWQFNGATLAGASGATLSLPNVQPTNVGAYTVVVGNAANTLTSAVANLTVNVRPTITVQPTNLIAVAGGSVTFAVAATGTAPLSYFWRLNGTPIPGARGATLTVNSVQGFNAGIYSVIVSNVVGSVLSAPALLEIIAAGPVQAWGLNDLGQTLVPPGLADAVTVAAGEYHSLALRANGTVVAWGDDQFGQTNVPPALVGVVAISANGDHSLALRLDGSVVAWGRNTEGQTNVPAGLAGIREIAAGHRHSLALRADGAVTGWGDNTFGQRTFPASATNVTAISAGQFHGLALRADGTVVGWGLNNYGQIAIPANVTNVVALSAGPYHNLALRVNGTVAAWGRNFAGETAVPAGLSNVVAIAAGYEHSVALRNDGTVVAWGANNSGQTNSPAMNGGIAIAAGGAHSLAVGPLVGAPPRITTGISGGNLILMWLPGSGVMLEQSPSLDAAVWTPVSATPPFVVPVNGALMFFRLRVP